MAHTKKVISIVVPDSLDNCIAPLRQQLTLLQNDDRYEIIFISKNMAETRAERLNIGLSKTSARFILFQHPRSFLEAEAYQLLLSKADKICWGGFTHAFDVSHPLLRFTSWYSNHIRAPKGIVYLDHCIYFHRQLWTENLPKMAIFEDTVLSQMLGRHTPPEILKPISRTSAVRFTTNGIWRQSLMNQFLKLAYYCGLSPAQMNSIYEKGLGLNDPPKK